MNDVPDVFLGDGRDLRANARLAGCEQIVEIKFNIDQLIDRDSEHKNTFCGVGLGSFTTVSQAYFALHETLHKVQNFQEKKIIFGTKVTSEAFLSMSQNLKVTRLQGGTQTKL